MGIRTSHISIKPAKIFLLAGLFMFAIMCIAVFTMRRYIYSPILNLGEKKCFSLYIPTGSQFDDVVLLLEVGNRLADKEAFLTMSRLMNYSDRIKPGHYVLKSDMSARTIIRKLRVGDQDPVNMTFSPGRSISKAIKTACRNLECDENQLLEIVNDTSKIRAIGFSQTSLFALFLPDTYQIWWNVSPDEWIERMKKEYDAFWNKERKKKAEQIGLTPIEVSTLASIINEESNKSDEYPIIASLYLNRLRIGMPLQACPTLKYALGDFSIRRVLKKHTELDSPYNTYTNRGLPPGPIRIASKQAIDAVLNPAVTDYLFMCARTDSSGRHDFSRTLAQHERNATNYHKHLDKKKIYK